MTSAEDIAKGMAAVIGANDEESTVSRFLDTGYPPLNYAMSSRWDGGMPVGRIIEVAGPPSSGKTAIATSVMAAAQRAGGIAGFMDHERSFSLQLAPKLGLDVTPGHFVFKKPRTFEESVSIAVQAGVYVREKKVISSEAPIVWVFDSLASMVPQSVLFDQKSGKERDPSSRNMNDNTALARATSAHLPAFSQWVEELNICAIFLNQVRTNIGVMYGDPRTTPGGDAPKFYASARLMLNTASKIKKGTEIIGMQITANVIKNKVARPFLGASWRFVFEKDGTGRFDVERSMVDFLEAEGLLKSPAKGYVTWDGVRVGKEALATRIRAEGKLAELIALLPEKYDPEEAPGDEAA